MPLAAIFRKVAVSLASPAKLLCETETLPDAA